MQYQVVKATVQDGFESKTVYRIVDSVGKIYATCDSKSDAHLEMKELDPLSNQKAEYDRVDSESADKGPQRESQAKSTAKEIAPCTKAEIKKVQREAKEGSLDVEAHHRKIMKMSPVVWADGADRGNSIERERYQLGNHKYQDSENEFEFYTSNPDKLGNEKDNPAKYQTEPNTAKAKIRKAVKQLSPQQRKVWELCGREMQISFEDASKILHISKSSVQTHYNRAIESIKRYIKDAEY